MAIAQIGLLKDHSHIIHVAGLSGHNLVLGKTITRAITTWEVKQFLRYSRRIADQIKNVEQEMADHELTKAIKDQNDILENANELGEKFYKYMYNVFLLLRRANLHLKKNLDGTPLWTAHVKAEKEALKDIRARVLATMNIIGGKVGIAGLVRTSLTQSESFLAERFGVVQKMKAAFGKEAKMEKILKDKKQNPDLLKTEVYDFMKNIRGSLLNSITILDRTAGRIKVDEANVKKARDAMLIPDTVAQTTTHNVATVLKFYLGIAHNMNLMINQLAGDL